MAAVNTGAASRVKWGILATGRIAQTYANGVAASLTGENVAVGSRDLASARAFAERNQIPRAYGSYEALLADPEVEAVYIATPHPMHLEWTLKTLAAGKHVLCEKPIGMNAREAEQMFAAARRADRLLMEAFMYRCHPQIAKLLELIRSGVLGTIGSVQASFSYNAPFDAASRTWARELGGGGILDVGCYPVSFSRLVAGAASGKPFLDPREVKALGALHAQTRVDVHTAAVLGFENGVIAQVSTAVGLYEDSSARVYGSKGWAHVLEPWLPNSGGRGCKLLLYRGESAPQEIPVVVERPLYAYEADAFGRVLRAGGRSVPEMSPEDTLGNLRTLDAWRAAIGLTYPADETSSAPGAR